MSETPRTDAERIEPIDLLNEIVSATFARQLETELAARDAELAEARERHGIQLAAISTACIQNSETSAKDRIGRENPYWTVAYGDVCVAIDREMKLRLELEEAMDKLSKQLEAFDAMKQVANDIKRERDEARRYGEEEHAFSLMTEVSLHESESELEKARSAIREAVPHFEIVLGWTRTEHAVRFTDAELQLAQLRSSLLSDTINKQAREPGEVGESRMTAAVLPCNCLTGRDPDCQAHHPQPVRE